MDVKEKDAVEIVMKEAVNLNFSLRFLTMFSKAAPLSSRVKLNLAPAIPLGRYISVVCRQVDFLIHCPLLERDNAER